METVMEIILEKDLPKEDKVAKAGPSCAKTYVTLHGLYFCTKPKGHGGDHVAHGLSNEALFRWGEEKVAEEEPGDFDADIT